MFLRQSTSQVIRFGPFLDSTDGVTPETALTIAQADMQLSKDGAAFAQKNAAGNATHDTDGWYSTTLDTTDSATVGELYMQVNVAGALPVWVRYWILEEAIYDDVYGASAAGYLQPTVAGRTLDISAGGNAGIDWANVETPGSTVNLSATTTNLVNTTTTNTDMRGTDSALLAANVPANFSDMSIAITTGLVDITQSAADKAWSTTTRLLTAATNITSDASPITMSSSGVVGTVNLVNTTTTNTDMRGTDSALLAANVPANFSDLSIVVTTGLVDITQAAADKVWSTTTRALTDKAGFSISGSITTLDGLNNLSAAQINAEVVDVLTVDTFAEVSGVPAATSTILDKLNWMFALNRNKFTSVAATLTLRNDADSGNIATASQSDDLTTYTRNEYT